MKKLAVSTLAVLLACPAFAGINHPDQGSSWQMWGLDPYIGLRGGMSYSNLNYKYDGNKESMTDYIFHILTKTPPQAYYKLTIGFRKSNRFHRKII